MNSKIKSVVFHIFVQASATAAAQGLTQATHSQLSSLPGNPAQAIAANIDFLRENGFQTHAQNVACADLASYISGLGGETSKSFGGSRADINSVLLKDFQGIDTGTSSEDLISALEILGYQPISGSLLFPETSAGSAAEIIGTVLS
ncbi:MAG: hypothetical protein ACYCOU_16520, partial [Sulfobacillus sp.]